MENIELKKTPYNQIHHDLGAKMAEFAGYDMPIQYTGLVEEHNNVRNNVGVFDVSHMGEFRAKGPMAKQFMPKGWKKLASHGNFITFPTARNGTRHVRLIFLTSAPSSHSRSMWSVCPA